MEKTNYNKQGGHKRRKHTRLAGKVIAVLQLILSGILLVLCVSTKALPAKYLVPIGLGLTALFCFTMGVQFVRRKMGLNVLGIVVSVILCIALGAGNYYISKTNHMLDNIGGADFKIDNMVVVVRADDPAAELLDIKDYQIGRQTAVDQENTQKMIDDINSHFTKDISLASYGTIEDMANALLDGRIEAAIYNQALLSTLEETVPGFEEKTKVIYSYGIETPVEVPNSRDVRSPFNVYISGIDVAGNISTTSRSDVNIIATVNPETKQVLLTSTPRDYFVPISGVSGGVKDKLTHAGIYGVGASIATLQELYDIQIDYYARVNFTTLIKVVDTLGGVDVQSDYAFKAGGYSFVRGTNHLDGKAALAFSRERYSFADGDNQRGRNQELVLTAIIEKALSPEILMNADSLIASVSESFETNMSKEQIGDLVRMQLLDHAKWSIKSTAATGTGASEHTYTYPRQKLYVMYPDEASVAQIHEKMKQVENGQKLS